MTTTLDEPKIDKRSTLASAPPTVRPTGRKRKWVLPIVAGLIALTAIALGTHYYIYSLHYESTDDAFVESTVVALSPKVSGIVAKVAVTDNELVREGQALVELDPRDLDAKVNEAKAQLAVAEARQAAATTQVGLTKTITAAAITQAESGVAQAESASAAATAQVAVAKSRQAQAEAGIATAEAGAAQAQAEVQAAEAEVTRATSELNRVQQAARNNAVSSTELTNATAGARSAEAQLEAARKRAVAASARIIEAKAAIQTAVEFVKAAQAQEQSAVAAVAQAKGHLAEVNVASERLTLAQSDLAAATADVQRLTAALKQAELNLSYTRIVAPQTGRVTRKNVEVGTYLQPGQAVMALVPEERWVTANFKETQVGRIRPGQSVVIHVDAYRDKQFTGHVDSIQRGTGSRFSLLPPENATGNYVKVVQRVPVKILFDQQPDPDHPLAPGMSAEPEVRVK